MISKMFLLLLTGSVVVSAQFPVVQTSLHEADDGWTIMKSTSLSNQITDAALSAKAAYNSEGSRGIREKMALGEKISLHDGSSIIPSAREVINFYATDHNGRSTPAGIITYENGRVTVAFHGTESLADGLTDLSAWGVLNGDFKNLGCSNLEEIGLKGSAHYGFYKRYMQSREAMFDVLNAVLDMHGQTYADVTIQVTGHSLGGALATLAAGDIQNQINCVIPGLHHVRLVTFNSPRVVNTEGAHTIESLLDGEAYRIWRGLDPVSAVAAGSWGGFKHVGQQYKAECHNNINILQNHSLDLMVQGALKLDVVPLSKNHKGFFGAIQSVSSQVKSSINSVKNSVKLWLGWA